MKLVKTIDDSTNKEIRELVQEVFNLYEDKFSSLEFIFLRTNPRVYRNYWLQLRYKNFNLISTRLYGYLPLYFIAKECVLLIEEYTPLKTTSKTEFIKKKNYWDND